MNKQKAYKMIKEETTKILIEEEKSKGGFLSNLITKFYMFIIKNDLEAAKQTLQQNPKLIKAAEDIKKQSEAVAKELLKNKEFVKYLLDIQDKE